MDDVIQHRHNGVVWRDMEMRRGAIRERQRSRTFRATPFDLRKERANHATLGHHDDGSAGTTFREISSKFLDGQERHLELRFDSHLNG